MSDSLVAIARPRVARHIAAMRNALATQKAALYAADAQISPTLRVRRLEAIDREMQRMRSINAGNQTA